MTTDNLSQQTIPKQNRDRPFPSRDACVLRGQRPNDDGLVRVNHWFNSRITERSVTVTQRGGYGIIIGQFRLST
jgi:hypothetical protein